MNYNKKIGDLDIYLTDIENRLDSIEEDVIYSQWKKFANGQLEDNMVMQNRIKKQSTIDWPFVSMNEAINDETLMLYSEFKKCSDRLSNESSLLLNIRANYGVGILPNTIAGVKFFMMDDEQNMLPNVYGIEGGEDRIEKFVNEPMPSIYSNVGQKVFSIGEKIMDIKSRYPKINKYILLDHPDCQGPMDICELLWGSDIFFELYEQPELVHKLLRKVTDFYKLFLDEWFRICPNDSGYHVPYGRLIKGKILVRDDSAVNLSPDFFDEFILPYDQELLMHFNGGGIHFCGKGEHFANRFPLIKGLNSVDMSQPHLNNLDIIFSNTLDKGINITTSNKDCLNNYKNSAHNMKLLTCAE